MEHWDEVRTAYQVARQGTVSGAAEVLGVHHATVIRHIDALEARLGVKLFQRHARGYTPTESGEDLARVAQTTEDQLQQLVGRIRGRGADVSGELMVTSIVELSNFLVPVLSEFKDNYPGVVLRYLTDSRVFRLEYGEAHVAIRAGSVPDEPDNVVQPLTKLKIGFYASRSYVEKHGLPKDEDDLVNHFFVGNDNPDGRAPFQQWLRAKVPYERVVFRATDTYSMIMAVRSGAGMGFMPVAQGAEDPDLVEVMPPKEEWVAPLWLVTHVDLHRTAKVQALLVHLKEAVKLLDAAHSRYD
jgi:DNA-binding transcriptional LysR family regulator